ncbi:MULTISPECIES: S-methyl-5-thioribose-1-phosphate isomerase [unclassified Methanoregula]|uniref:S-methyl-5-thioribose-1-phosphate isomerase n=1 Tax=unclassified Methanoregula TaxID=2649730 RepID=UPI0009C435B6|nr:MULTISPECIES: S-methyl-5-thioribose-1-phosphate isomerase [unclassified Methanoregula]OPX65552.1 MAG: putative methylthioribose-1-phosphate isomerase [Methanoregula sp. PtaB.Bin085]OPY35831.1 MAG: putative methylthioribose-1-phosphate isomerase [Methanoregula sp. PtaU1.Bin006]
MSPGPTLWWDKEAGSICYIDQTLLPGRERIVTCRSVRQLARAIRKLGIRGAPALGVAGAFGIALSASLCRKKDPGQFHAQVTRDAELLRSTRPTAVNLGWGIDRVLGAMRDTRDVQAARAAALAEAELIFIEDTACCHAIGDHGAALLPDTCTVLTHCNAGALACSSWGTALGVIRSAVQAGKQVNVIACETRPLLQGARLTAWELLRDGIPVTVITDSMAAHIMRNEKIDAVIVGADRITRDAVFNKIGTYMHAVCARHHGIPFYVAAPLSTFDLKRMAVDVVIEERGREEVAVIGNRIFVPPAASVKNPAFDATPLELVTAIVTEKGVVRPPFTPEDLSRGRTK